jgi:hypothetical protein
VNFAQYGLDALTHGPFKGNPIPINASLAVAGFVVGVILVTFVSVASRNHSTQEESNEDEREPLLVEED